MDLTNIKPCVECAVRDECRSRYSTASIPRSVVRMNCILVIGEDCFVEVDDDNYTAKRRKS